MSENIDGMGREMEFTGSYKQIVLRKSLTGYFHVVSMNDEEYYGDIPLSDALRTVHSRGGISDSGERYKWDGAFYPIIHNINHEAMCEWFVNVHPSQVLMLSYE